MLEVERVLASGKSLFMAIFSSRGAMRGRDESGSEAVRLSTCILFGMVSGVSVAFSKRRISSGQNYENPGKTMKITGK
jgi:hypothetical protein